VDVDPGVMLDLLDIGNAGLGFLNSAIGVGGLVGVALAFALVGRKRLASDFAVGLILIGLGLGLIGVWPTTVAALLLMGVFGIGNTLVDVSGMTLMQRAAPEEVLARVFGVLESLLLLTVGLGALVAPLLVILSYFMGPRPMDLVFSPAEVLAVFLSVRYSTSLPRVPSPPLAGGRPRTPGLPTGRPPDQG